MVTQIELTEFLEKRHWVADRFGHLQLNASNGRRYRFLFKKISFRLEVWEERTEYRRPQWYRLRSGYLSQLAIINDKIAGILYGTDMEFLFNAKVNFPPEIVEILDPRKGGI